MEIIINITPFVYIHSKFNQKNNKGIYYVSEHVQQIATATLHDTSSNSWRCKTAFPAKAVTPPSNKYFRHQKIRSDSFAAISKNQHTYHRCLVSHANQEFPMPVPDRYNKLQYPPGALQQFRME